MNVDLVYLDSSSILKRYVEGRCLECSIKGLLSEDMFKTALLDFLSESIKMVRLGSLQILPVTAKSLIESWLLILKYHIYETDALQIATSKEASCDLLLSADERLIQVARNEGINAIDLEAEPEKALGELERRR